MTKNEYDMEQTDLLEKQLSELDYKTIEKCPECGAEMDIFYNCCSSHTCDYFA
jgi:ssDNA-binding Zn-finger/Zn-ribbon topoisomerase 1